MTSTAQYDFEMIATEKDCSGYYYPNWDNAVPLTVRATTRAEAFGATWAVLGEPNHGRGWTWTAKIKSIKPASQPTSAPDTP